MGSTSFVRICHLNCISQIANKKCATYPSSSLPLGTRGWRYTKATQNMKIKYMAHGLDHGTAHGEETGKGLRKGPLRPFSQALSPGLFPKLRNFPKSCPEIKPELVLEVTQNIGNPYTWKTTRRRLRWRPRVVVFGKN